VLIEGGRATADPEFGVVRHNYYARPEQSLASATWFLRDGKDSKQISLIPLPEVEAIAVEDLYQQAVYAASSFGKGIDPLLKEEIPIEGEYHVCVQKSEGQHYVLKKCPNGWLGKSYNLQRGYGAYIVEGEEEEETLGPVRQLVFVVHGIGETMWSREDVTFTSSLIQDVVNLRLTMQRRQIAEWKKQCEKAKREK
jgi:hypothetical protein